MRTGTVLNLNTAARLLTSLAPLSWDPIIKYIKDQHSAYLRKELTAMRDRYIQDTRIHCCLYFINPTGHALRAIDVIVMKKLSEVVNVVPVIAKADSLTLEERDAFKQKVCRFGLSVELTADWEVRFVPSSSTTTSAFTPSTLMRMTKRRYSSTRESAYVCLFLLARRTSQRDHDAVARI
jgi:hypothetical protein